MTSLEKKNKRKGIIGTILFHALLLVAFLFMGLTYQVPPPPEEGIAIDFGNEGQGNINPEVEEVEDQIKSTEEILTQSEIEAPTAKKTEKIINNEKPIEEKKPEVNKKAIYTPKGSGGKGDGKGSGKSDGEGDGEGNNGNGSGKGNGSGDYQLGDREAIEKPKPQGNQAEGKVVVIITVDRLGNVIYANPGIQGSTTLNKDLLERSKKAALKTKFEPKPSAPENQQGKIIYDFRLN